MTQEEKELLLKDLCARAIYGVHCATYRFDGRLRCDDDIVCYVEFENIITEKANAGECFMFYQVKPYLRPLSSMTEEERKYKDLCFKYDYLAWEYIDWLNAHHFDYRGLIEKGLALKAPEDMYN